MKLFLILLLVCLCNNLIAQVNLTADHLIEFRGVVQDSTNNEIIPNANIRFYLNEQLVKRAVSNNNGEFKVMLPKGNYSYIISCVGFNYKKGTIDSTVHNNKAFEIKLSEATNTTSEVVIQTNRNKIGSVYCEQFRSGCIFTYKPYQWLVINPSNYMRGPFLVPPKERQ